MNPDNLKPLRKRLSPRQQARRSYRICERRRGNIGGPKREPINMYSPYKWFSFPATRRHR